MQTSIIIPALNEAESIGKVLRNLPARPETEVIVVDGGSGDDTCRIAQAAGAMVILQPQPGYGLACATGLAAAAGDLVIFMDADGADEPSHIPQLIAPLIAGEADLVLGSRLAGRVEPGAMPWHQYLGNWLCAQLIRRLYRLPVTDLSPFRAVDRLKLLQLELHEMTYGWPTEMITRAARRGWCIREIPVTCHPRQAGRSKISGTLRGTILATYYILRTILKYSRSEQ